MMTNIVLMSVGLAASANFCTPTCPVELEKCAVTVPHGCSSKKVSQQEPVGLQSNGLHTEDVAAYFSSKTWIVACYSKKTDDKWHFKTTRIKPEGSGLVAKYYNNEGRVVWLANGTLRPNSCYGHNYIHWTGYSKNNLGSTWGGERSRRYIIDVQPNATRDALNDDNAVISYITCWEDEGMKDTTVYVTFKKDASDKKLQDTYLQSAVEAIRKLTCIQGLGNLECIECPVCGSRAHVAIVDD